ncbi:MAG: hypothetical protein QMB62_04655 [Oscillospiraceae bacterium]
MRNMKPEKRIAANNDGSAIVTVVISMVFIMALGMALLFAAYTGYSVEITQRGDKENFYDASSAMDDIRLGVQTLLSESIVTAYTQVLTDYVGTHASDYDPQEDFNNKIIAQLTSKTVTVGGSTVGVFTLGTDTYGNTIITGYDANALGTLIDAQLQGNSIVTGAGSTSRAYSSQILSSISLNSLSVKYVKDGYESNITTDITITMPYFFASSSVTSSINNYAIIANTALIHGLETGVNRDVSIKGSVFAGAGGINVKDSEYKLGLSGGDIICKGTISVDESGALNFNSPDNQLWTDKIDVGNFGSVTLNGSVFTANDLTLKENGASATLQGTYFGFGDSTDNSEKSSSILINGRNCALDISGLSKLSLAGVSFINTSSQYDFDTVNNSYSDAIPMGESLSVKSDQLAYLVPIKCISNFSSNPCAFPSTASKTDMTPTVDLNTVLWGTGDDAKTLGDYISGKGTVETLYKNIDSDWKIVYAFIVFSSRDYANEYFKDYFAADPAKIEQYLNLYLINLSDKSDNAKINTAGNTFYVEDNSTATTTDDKLTLNPASDSVYAAGAQLLYNKMQSSYLVFVNTVAMSKLPSGTTLEFKSGDDVVAVVSNGGYDYDVSSPTSLRLIIASGDVALINNSTHDGVRGFLGIVISGGNVTVNTDVTGDPLTSDILNSTCTVGTKTYKLSDFINNSAQIEGGSNASEDLWNLDSLVYYENWLKN